VCTVCDVCSVVCVEPFAKHDLEKLNKDAVPVVWVGRANPRMRASSCFRPVWVPCGGAPLTGRCGTARPYPSSLPLALVYARKISCRIALLPDPSPKAKLLPGAALLLKHSPLIHDARKVLLLSSCLNQTPQGPSNQRTKSSFARTEQSEPLELDRKYHQLN